jgi:hypothetical protein
VTENDSFPTTVPAPDVGDVTYPAVVADAIDRLADRTRYHENTFNGNYTAVAIDQLTVGDTLQQFVNLPPNSRVGALGADSLLSPWRAIATPLLQNIRWLKQRLAGLRSGTVVLFYQPIIVDGSVNTTPRWRTTKNFSGVPVAVQVDNASTGNMSLGLPGLPCAGTITRVDVRIQGDPNSTHVGLPANMPSMAVNKYTATTGAISVLGTGTDTSANLTAYRTLHTISVTGLNEDLTAAISNNFYDVKFTGEYGANSETLALFVNSVEVWVAGPTV